ncbi:MULTISPECIES: YiiX/YebB-like N1pC/P60 family cysteine hydrolase [unclassified Halobacteriovorax]|uniref:YiiX/YebB-like N1pC/P60 family cysteine hydrolase n=1 Tax=unclassified Halobacteriovorax TaxID=2639665 RepID=UPI00399954D4
MKNQKLTGIAGAIIVSTLLVSCNQKSYRMPSSLKSSKFESLMHEMHEQVSKGVKSPAECATKTEHYYNRLFSIKSTDIDFSEFSQYQMQDFVNASFNIRLDLKEKLKDLNSTKELDQDEKQCLKGVKDIFRALRYLEDYFIESYYASRPKGKVPRQFSTLNFDGDSPIHFMVNPEYSFSGPRDLKSGDIILSRGNAYSSAAIARIGDDDHQFSHLTLVYKDKKTGELFTSEAHIEVGNVVAPFQVHLDQANSRTVVFRHKDAKLAHLAAKEMHERFSKFTKKHDKNIPYDFAMDYNDDSQIFCSEVIYHGYKVASEKLSGTAMDIPEFKTSFNPALLSFLQDFGLQVTSENIAKFKTFGPGEIQFDSRFDLVAEWRNPDKLKDTRYKDAILSKIFEWMEKERYEFDPSFGTKLGNDFAWLARRSVISRGIIKFVAGVNLEEKFPLNLGSKQIDLFVVLDQVGEKLYERIAKAEKEAGGILSFNEMFQELESYRKEDLDKYTKYIEDKKYNQKLQMQGGRRNGPRRRRSLSRPDFHHLFHN